MTRRPARDQLALMTEEVTMSPTRTPASDKTADTRFKARMAEHNEAKHRQTAPAKKMLRGKALIKSASDPRDVGKTVAQAIADKARREGRQPSVYDANAEKPMTREAARALLAHDPNYLGDITNAALADLLDDVSVKKHHPAIRRELRVNRGLTQRKAP